MDQATPTWTMDEVASVGIVTFTIVPAFVLAVSSAMVPTWGKDPGRFWVVLLRIASSTYTIFALFFGITFLINHRLIPEAVNSVVPANAMNAMTWWLGRFVQILIVCIFTEIAYGIHLMRDGKEGKPDRIIRVATIFVAMALVIVAIACIGLWIETAIRREEWLEERLRDFGRTVPHQILVMGINRNRLSVVVSWGLLVCSGVVLSSAITAMIGSRKNLATRPASKHMLWSSIVWLFPQLWQTIRDTGWTPLDVDSEIRYQPDGFLIMNAMIVCLPMLALLIVFYVLATRKEGGIWTGKHKTGTMLIGDRSPQELESHTAGPNVSKETGQVAVNE